MPTWLITSSCQYRGGKKAPDDLLSKKEWDHFMQLPTDVLLRTADYLGTMVEDMLARERAWVEAMPTEPAVCPFMFDAALDTADEFAAAPFIAAHGWYRQATDSNWAAMEHGMRGTGQRSRK